MVIRPVLLAVAVGSAVAAIVWGRSASRLRRAWLRISGEIPEGTDTTTSADLARSAFRKELHTALLYGLLALTIGVASLSDSDWYDVPLLLLDIPIFITLRYGPRFLAEARLVEERSLLERRAAEVLEQDDLAPRRWAARLAPPMLPVIDGYEVGWVYAAGTGLMAGDFYDLYPTGPHRLAAVIGDVTGHGIEASITAFQVKYLLRVFLVQYRDPAQALEELNSVMSAQGRGEEFVSLCVVQLDSAASTLRYASAGHPPAWLWHDGEVRPLRATGPLLTLEPDGHFFSREVPLVPGDLVLLYTDGLAEARSGEQLFGEERIAAHLRRDPGVATQDLCTSLLDAARDFSDSVLRDDVAILAVRRT